MTDVCPHYAKKRDDHPDAQRKKLVELMGQSGDAYMPEADVIKMPGDGSCLFHSLAYGLGRFGNTSTASALRARLMDWLSGNGDANIADTPVREWVKGDSGSSVANYTARMRGCGWGGGIEMAAFAHLHGIGVCVYERTCQSIYPYKRIARFDAGGRDGASEKYVDVLYCGGVHYDALVARAEPVELENEPRNRHLPPP